MQQDVSGKKVDNFSPSEIVAMFPEAKATVKRLIKETEELCDKNTELKKTIRENLSKDSRVGMMDLYITIELVYALTCSEIFFSGVQGKWRKTETIDERLRRLQRLMYLYEPPKKTTNGITDADIQRAKEVPITLLCKVRMNVTLCPFHNEKTPSMHVYKDNHAYCFGCHKRADAIDIAMQLQGLNFVDAVKWLNRL